MSILVIEDDPKTGDYLKKGLRESGYAVDLARNGTDGLHMALEHSYDLVVLDVMLPGKDGWQVMRELRDKCPCATCREQRSAPPPLATTRYF